MLSKNYILVIIHEFKFFKFAKKKSLIYRELPFFTFEISLKQAKLFSKNSSK